MNKEKMFEIVIAKEYGQELVDKIKLLPDETHLNGNGHKDGKQNRSNIQIHASGKKKVATLHLSTSDFITLHL